MNRDKFKFVDDLVAREPYVFEVLKEIQDQQHASLPEGTKSLATVESLKRSRGIKMPLSPAREKTIEYIVDLLLTRYPRHLNTLVTFDFKVDDATKKLSVIENREFTLTMDDRDYEKLRRMRDELSSANLLNLIKMFRFFNITKLMKVTKNKSDLQRIIDVVEGTRMFIFKNYSLDKNRLEFAEDYCFHTQNYSTVRDTINLNHLKDILARYAELVERRLKKFGIINAYFSDYRDSKLDYIFNILVEDIPSAMTDYDRLDVKNIHSLRACILRVDSILDPTLILGKDIIHYIRENPICTASDLINSIMELNGEILEKWTTPENLKSERILHYTGDDGADYFIDGTKFVDYIAETHHMIQNQPEKLAEMPYQERQKKLSLMNILYKSARMVLSSEEKKIDIRLAGNAIDQLKKIVHEYEAQLKKKSQRNNAMKMMRDRPGKMSLIERIIAFFKSIFKGRTRAETPKMETAFSPARELSKESRQYYSTIATKKGPLLALSDFIELIPENDHIVDSLINDMRIHNLKIVIPIYNAREILYPKRSLKVLMPDIEYLLVPQENALSPELIRRFTDSLVGVKIKDEEIPARAIMAVEKYLLTLYRQKRSMLVK